MNKLPVFVGQILSDSSGNPSSTRVALLLVLILTLGPWAAVCLHNWQISDVPEGVRWVIGIIASAKAAQKFGEGKPSSPGEPEQPQKS